MASDHQLRDATAFGEIVDSCRQALYRRARQLSGDSDTAEELVQETFARAWARFGQFQKGTNAAAWLTSILSHFFLDCLKHQKVESRAAPQLATPEAVELTPALFSVTDADLYAAVQALKPRLREVVELCYFERLRRSEVSARLNVPEGTIGTRLMRARKQLHRLLTNPPRDSR